MSIEARLRSALIGHTGLAALVGTRVYPLQLPETPTLPALTYLRVSTIPLQTRSTGATTYAQARFQIDGRATTFDNMVALRKQIRAAMGAFQLAATPRVDVARLVGDVDILEAEPNRWRCTLDYMLHYQED